MRRMAFAALLACALAALAAPVHAQAVRQNAIWARTATGPIKLDGILDEPAWAKAESYTIKYAVNSGNPGSGWKEEGGKLAKDSTVAVIKFLVVGDSLFMAATVKDSSIGGSADFNRFDGFLMSIKDHRDPFATAHGPTEYLYSWWHPETAPAIASSPGQMPGFRGYWTPQSDTIPRTTDQISAWNAGLKLRGGSGGITNTDTTAPDSGYTVEMRFDLGVMGYTPRASGGDIVEFNISIYDTDWMWPLNGARFSVNRTWWQSPWGNAQWYDQLAIHVDPTVTTNTTTLPVIGPDVRIPNAGGYATPTIDGFLTEPVWQTTQHLDIRYGDFDVRNTYGNPLKWRAGMFEAPVNGNGGGASVIDPGDATVKMFFKADSLFMGFDVRDQYVQSVNLFDRYDGFLVTIQDTLRASDHNLTSRRLGFHVGPTGNVATTDYLDTLVNLQHSARIALRLKPGTSLDTTGTTTDTGYTAELVLDLTKFGLPHGLGSGNLWIGIDLQDGDSFSSITDSYGTRTWWGREFENECCPATAYLDPNSFVTAVDDPAHLGTDQAALLGNRPNPFRATTIVSFALPQAARATLDVYDVTGRRVASSALGIQPAGTNHFTFARPGLGTGVYLYRIRLAHPQSGAALGTLSGKMMVVR